MKNLIQFRKGFVNIPNSKADNTLLAMTVNAELMQFGYMLDEAALRNLGHSTKADINQFYKEVIPFLKDITGSKRTYKPFWSGFPEEVMEKSEYELWLHQCAHYLSNGKYIPEEWMKPRAKAFEHPTYKIITEGTEAQFHQIFTDLVSVNQSLTKEDLDIIQWFATNVSNLQFPEQIPFKENLCTLAAMKLPVPVKTVTDVLRIATHMSGGDISLPAVPPKTIKTGWGRRQPNTEREKFKFRKFSRPERKYILGLLERTNCDVREMALKDGRWIRLGEILHPGEYAKYYPKSFKMFKDIRNEKVVSWYGEVVQAENTGIQELLDKLAERPGEFVRKVDYLLRTYGSIAQNEILNTLTKVLDKASNKVSFEIYTHFQRRTEPVTNRTITIKGKRSKTKLPDLPAFSKDVVEAVSLRVMGSLKDKFRKLPAMGNTWIDPELKKLPVPTNMRSLNPALVPIIRGQRVPLGNKDAKVIRAYVHWYDERGSRDLDLSATLISETGKPQTSIGWNARHSGNIGYYSGDVRHRKGACAEYIDIVIDQSLKEGYRYVCPTVHNYNGGGMNSVPEVCAGYMERETPEGGDMHFTPTIANSMKLQSTADTVIIALLDLQEMEYVFLDIDQAGIPVATAQNLLDSIKPYMEDPEFSVYDLLEMHVDARGTLETDETKATTLLKLEDFSKSYVETLKWMGV